MHRLAIPALLAAALAAVGAMPTPSAPAPAADANNRFALDLLAQFREQPGNLLVSPYSIETALAMTSAGARGATEEQMARVLHLPADAAQRHEACAALIKQTLAPAGPGRPTLRVANRLFGAPGFAWKPEFLQTTASRYAAGLETTDFPGSPDAARQVINGWVAGQTEQKIKNLLGPSDVDALTRLVLVNAVYFHGDWKVAFQAWETNPAATFHLAPEQDVKVPMMGMTAALRYAESANWQALELPYTGGDQAMVVLLPRQVDGLAGLEKHLTAEQLTAVVGGLKRADVMVRLPKFRMESKFELGAALQKLGMTDAFDIGRADFSGMAEAKLSISKVIHQTYVDVDEKGTEAAAATGVVLPLPGPGGGGGGAPLMHFQADHPFLFLIRDNRTGAVLFLGRLADPKA
jgi:serpin B